MQECKWCGAAKTVDEFYANDKSCKVCRRAFVSEHRQRNIEKIRAYDRVRGHDEKRQAANRRQYRERRVTQEGRLRENKRAQMWVENHRHNGKRAVNIMVSNAIRNGKLTPEKCWWCGSEEHIHAHHEDYTKPLEIMWLCRDCHGRRHRGINEAARLAG